MSEKSGEGDAATVNATVAMWVCEPDAPVSVIVDVPAAAEDPAASVSI